MLNARREARRLLGVVPGTSSQTLVDAMIAVENAGMIGDVAGEKRALSGPAFTLGPDGTLQRLVDLPSLPVANVASVAEWWVFPIGGS